MSGGVSDLQQHLAAVDAHGIHGAKGHEGDGDGRRRVHRIVVTGHREEDGVRRTQTVWGAGL